MLRQLTWRVVTFDLVDNNEREIITYKGKLVKIMFVLQF